MTMLPADGRCVTTADSAPPTGLERILRWLSVITMLMTVPQVWTIWIERQAAGVSLISWLAYLVSACLWFVYGLRKDDKTIYVACVGWVLLDAAIVVGILMYR